MGHLVNQDLRSQQPQWSASAGCSLRDCCYLADTQGRSHLLAAAADGSLHLSCPSQGDWCTSSGTEVSLCQNLLHTMQVLSDTGIDALDKAQSNIDLRRAYDSTQSNKNLEGS